MLSIIGRLVQPWKAVESIVAMELAIVMLDRFLQSRKARRPISFTELPILTFVRLEHP